VTAEAREEIMRKTQAKTMEATPGRERNFVNSLARGLDLLAAFEAEDRSLGNQELADRTRIAEAHRFTSVAYLDRNLVI
jgi:hypothetical protein